MKFVSPWLLAIRQSASLGPSSPTWPSDPTRSDYFYTSIFRLPLIIMAATSSNRWVFTPA